MKIIKIDNLEVNTVDFGQVEHCRINNIKYNWQDGWRIPRKEELDLIYDFKIKHGLFDEKYYWTSNQYIIDTYSSGAWVKHFGNGRNFHFGELFPAYVLSVRDVNDKEYLKNGIVELHFCGRIEVLQYDFGLVDWQEAKHILLGIGNDWRIPTIQELNIIKPYKNQIIDLRSDYYWGIDTEDSENQYTNSYFGYDFRFKDDINIKNNLFLVRSEKPIFYPNNL
jgi:hypothetical protein